MKNVLVAKYTIARPYICQVKVWHPSEPRYAWCLAYLSCDGLYHLDSDSLDNAAYELGVEPDDLYVNSAEEE